MKKLTDDQWKIYTNQYGKLMWSISKKISGDAMIAQPEDNYSDLCIAALESVEGYRKKTGIEFDEAMGTKLFDQYTKTVLWNRKAKKGIPLTNRMSFRNKHFSINSHVEGEDKVYDIEEMNSSLDLSSIFIEDTFKHKNPDVKAIVDAIVKDPSVVTEEGKLKCAALMGPTGLTLYRISKAIDSIKILAKQDSCDE